MRMQRPVFRGLQILARAGRFFDLCFVRATFHFAGREEILRNVLRMPPGQRLGGEDCFLD